MNNEPRNSYFDRDLSQSMIGASNLEKFAKYVIKVAPLAIGFVLASSIVLSSLNANIKSSNTTPIPSPIPSPPPIAIISDSEISIDEKSVSEISVEKPSFVIPSTTIFDVDGDKKLLNRIGGEYYSITQDDNEYIVIRRTAGSGNGTLSFSKDNGESWKELGAESSYIISVDENDNVSVKFTKEEKVLQENSYKVLYGFTKTKDIKFSIYQSSSDRVTINPVVGVDLDKLEYSKDNGSSWVQVPLGVTYVSLFEGEEIIVRALKDGNIIEEKSFKSVIRKLSEEEALKHARAAGNGSDRLLSTDFELYGAAGPKPTPDIVSLNGYSKSNLSNFDPSIFEITDDTNPSVIEPDYYGAGRGGR